MKNAVWHFIWLPRMCSGWPSFLMKRFESPAALHYWHSLNTWDRLRVCNKLCCTVLLRTEVMCGDFTFQHHSALGFSIKRSTAPVLLPKQVFTSCFLFCGWYVYISSISRLRHLIINSISSQGWRHCDKCQVTVQNKYHFVRLLWLCSWVWKHISLEGCLGFGRWSYNMTILRHSLSFSEIRWMVTISGAILCSSPLENVNRICIVTSFI